MKKRIVSAILALCLLLPMLPATARAEDAPASGECGADGSSLTWTLSGDGVLTISGTGEMKDYSQSPFGPDVKSLVIENGVTTIGSHAFENCVNLTSVEIANSLTSIGASAFKGCTGLTTIQIPKNVETIREYAFQNCSLLESIGFSKSLTDIYQDAFSGCDKLKTVNYGSSKENFEKISYWPKDHKPGDAISLKPEPIFPSDPVIHYDYSDIPYLVYFVTMDNDNHMSSHYTKRVTHGTPVELPPDPTQIGYTFVKWYKDKDCTTPWDFTSDTITEETYIYAKWEETNYTVTFDTGGGTLVDSVTVPKGGTMKKPSTEPALEGFGFLAWYKDQSYQTAWDFQRDTVNADTTLYAKWGKLYKITFDPNSGALSNGISQIQNTDKYGKLANIPIPIEQEDYNFDGWYTERIGGEQITLQTVFTEDTTVYARWTEKTSSTPSSHTVIFDLNYENAPSSIPSQTVNHGEKAKKPDDPQREGYTFAGWYTGKDCVTPWDLDAEIITGPITFYAKWTAEPSTPVDPAPDETTWTVTFDSQGGSAVPAVTVKDGEKATKPGDPTRSGYTFGGWFKEPDGTTLWNFDQDKVTESITLYAKWTAEPSVPVDPAPDETTWTVTFNSQGGSAVPAVTVKDGEKVTKPGDPTRSGYTFGGWFREAACTTAWSFDSAVTGSITLYAKWTAEPSVPVDPAPAETTWTVTFNSQSGSAVPAVTVKDGEKVTKPGDPTRSGYTFGGWFREAACTTAWSFDSAVTGNLTLYAKWTANPTTPSATRYRIYTPGSVSGGDYDVSHSYATEGTRVTIDLEPRSRYELDWIQVTNRSTGREVSLTRRSDDRYTFIMPDSAVELELSYISIYSGAVYYYDPIPPRAQPGPTAWYYSSRHIYHVTDGMVPDSAPITRDMLISVLYNLTDESLLPAPGAIGSQTNGSHVWAVNSSIIPDIYAIGLWGLDRSLSRDQMALMVFQYAKYRGYDVSQSTPISRYADHGQVRASARNAMSWALAAGLLSGTSNAALSPRSAVNCGQAGDLLYRFLSSAH